MSWIAITTAPNKTRRVRKRLRRLGMTAYVPAICQTRIIPKGGRARRRRHITVLMPYVLVKAPAPEIAALWLHQVISVKDVQGVIQSGDAAATIPDASVERLKINVACLKLETEARQHRRRLRKGGKARIIAGSLAGRAGTVAWVAKNRVGLEATLFGATRVVVVEKEKLEAA